MQTAQNIEFFFAHLVYSVKKTHIQVFILFNFIDLRLSML